MGTSKRCRKYNTETDINEETGRIYRIRTEENAFEFINDEPEYFKIYCRAIAVLQEQVSLKALGLFVSLCAYMTYTDSTDYRGSQRVRLSAADKKMIQALNHWKSPQSYYDAMKELIEVGVIRKIGQSDYQINPYFSSRGVWKCSRRNETGGIADFRRWWSGEKCIPDKMQIVDSKNDNATVSFGISSI